MTGRHRPAPSGAHAARGGRHGRRAGREGPVGVAGAVVAEAVTVSVASMRRMPRPLVIPIAVTTVLAVAFTAAAAPGGDAGTPSASPQWPYTNWVIPTVAPDLAASTTVVPEATAPVKAKAAKQRKGATATKPKKKYIPVAADLAASGIPAPAMRAYKKAARWAAANDSSCGLKWELLAAIGRVESGHGTTGDAVMTWSGASVPGIYGPVLDGRGPFALIRDTEDGRVDRDKKYDRAVGPMQFLPATWAVVGRDGDGDGKLRVQDIDDAALGAAVYLCLGKKSTSTADGLRSNIFRYNRSDAYVDLVIGVMQQYGAKVPKIVPAEKAPTKKKSTSTTSKKKPSTSTPSRPAAPKPAPSPSTSPKPSPTAGPPATTPPSEPPATSPPATPDVAP
jgi:membrane-bound lytic murein transglycosylase B